MRLEDLLGQKRQELAEIEARTAGLLAQIETLKAEAEPIRAAIQAIETTAEIARQAGVRNLELDNEAPIVEPRRKDRVRPKGRTKPKGRATAGRLIAAIRRAVQSLGPEFSTGDVRGKIDEFDPDLAASVNKGSIAGTLRRMVDEHELQIVEKGGPGKPATYRREG